jgi:hypothetical protein
LHTSFAAHARPQAPQLAGLVCVSTQTLPHRIWGLEQAQAPFAQVAPPEQVRLQAPQWLFEVCRWTHAPPQLVRPAAQLAAHAPALHAWPAGQAVPQAPQFIGSLAASTHFVPPQSRVPAGQTQALPLQICGAAQVLPQLPQFPPLDVRFTHAPAHGVSPAAHAPAQRPRLHTWPAAQARPQAPQFCGLDSGFTQAAPQTISPAAH